MFPVGLSTEEDANFSIHSHVLWVSSHSFANRGYEPQVLLGANILRDYDGTIYLMDLSCVDGVIVTVR